MQTAYLKVLDGRARYRGGEFKAFLFGVIRLTARDERRRMSLRRAISLEWLTHEPSAPKVAPMGIESLVSAETSRRLVGALERLSSRQREVLVLVFFHGMTIADAAETLEISLGTARTHYERGKSQLRRLLAEPRD